MRSTGGSNHIERVRRDPDVELLKAALERFFEALEKLAMLRAIRNVDKKSHEVVLINGAAVLPCAADGLCLP